MRGVGVMFGARTKHVSHYGIRNGLVTGFMYSHTQTYIIKGSRVLQQLGSVISGHGNGHENKRCPILCGGIL